MKKKYIKILEKDIKKSFTIKRIILNLIFIITVFIYNDFFSNFINNYFTPKVFPNSFLVISIFILILFLSFIGISYKILKNKYNNSTNEINLIFLILFLVCYFSYWIPENKWTLVKFEFGGLNVFYVNLIIIILILTLFVIFIRYLDYLGENKEIESANNILLDDSPILIKADDKLDYQETVKNLTDILYNDNHKKSFTIGLVGPWGNGKSSVLKMVEKELEEKICMNNSPFIIFNFLPYLNHKENDIINEFFTCLSNELKPYSGKLSDLITEYSSTITDIYENKNILGFIESHVTDFKNSSANELYSLINDMLSDVNKKIIVFIDDLDRLNKDEILQVFKLIRNTADFRNTTFVVAMDKEYVLRSLKKSKKIFHSSFIDKFFQLEIYLPEIDKSKLKERFLLELNSSILNGGSPDFGYKIMEAIDNEGNLFNDYVKNIRDVKRLVNQVIYDFPSTGGEIDMKDFLNFTYFKLKFPNFIYILKQGIGDIIELDDQGKYNLKEKIDGNENNSESFSSDKIFKILSKQQSFNPKKYELYNEEFFNNCLLEDQTIDCENKYLLLKTLAFMFGIENTNNDVSSIKNENNLRILLEQKVPKNRLINNEFTTLINSELENIINIIDEFYKNNKLEQLLSRFNFFTASKNESEYKNSILALVYIFEKRRDFSIYEANIILQISVFAHKLNDEEEGLNIDLKQWSLENIFQNKTFNIETRVLLLGHLRNGALGSKFKVTLWRFKPLELNELILKLFQEYLEDSASLISNPNNYSLYHVYHTIKSGIKNEVTKKIIEFWSTSNLELLCAQITDLDSWPSSSFKIADVINEFFNSKINFIQFVKSHKDSNNSEIEEFLALYNLLQISEFKYTCMFKFEKSTLMLAKIEYLKQFKIGKDENQGLTQLVLETNSLNFIEGLHSQKDLERKYGIRIHEYNFSNNVVYYMFVYLKENLGNNPVLSFTQELYRSILPFTDWEKTAFVANNIDNGKNLIPQKNNNYYLKVISIEPRKKQ
ncbi:AAA family ATPase [Flavobacterium jejuense]|uniref:AAA family ATPase n=1 Tax=Flavobacterium jejuense TaxID=1544455 RepID=A0ABX0IME6_9FLAO|nr:P-loop NTPase fold protein [Flavobacterium jejuense]NHN24989.1 AAA family ATPase [Flavobacterium jejuense]